MSANQRTRTLHVGPRPPCTPLENLICPILPNYAATRVILPAAAIRWKVATPHPPQRRGRNRNPSPPSRPPPRSDNMPLRPRPRALRRSPGTALFPPLLFLFHRTSRSADLTRHRPQRSTPHPPFPLTALNPRTPSTRTRDSRIRGRLLGAQCTHAADSTIADTRTKCRG